jgi:hypothetical protein
MNLSTASAGMRTARPQFTRGSLRRSSHARIVAGFTAKASLASLTLNNFCISFASGRNRVLPEAEKSVAWRWYSGGIPVVFRVRDSSTRYSSRLFAVIGLRSSLVKA